MSPYVDKWCIVYAAKCTDRAVCIIYIIAVCGRAEYAITHNGQPIRRRDEADTL
jgi:hypothetical protein